MVLHKPTAVNNEERPDGGDRDELVRIAQKCFPRYVNSKTPNYNVVITPSLINNLLKSTTHGFGPDGYKLVEAYLHRVQYAVESHSNFHSWLSNSVFPGRVIMKDLKSQGSYLLVLLITTTNCQ